MGMSPDTSRTQKSRQFTGYRKSLIKLVRPERFELPTPWFVATCSILLSYGRN